MRLIIQRVNTASVTDVEAGNVTGKIDKGYFVLVGVKKGDSERQAEILANKLIKLRVMADSEEKMNLTVNDVEGSFLIVSQFTLYADTTGGNRPSFINAALPEEAQKIYDYFVNKVRQLGGKVETGKFGAYMKIDTQLDGPVTILIEN